ncbi:hydroxymethylbilane synthase [Stratiformator vulcanicus]|uniref:Porphobilinogen deaminase n=1 Tax=Stratiformator vulcanicus TaxID=2527980 RepID=A0A517R532_9PLAN|nr:hydroxymethylbilane synthase [Stratiformator vulcanicus]QDT38950.1 Porphobilinogen deaminase [Stratiformator vulcanicus]
MRTLRIATRASRLAVWQAEHVRSLLQSRRPEQPVDLVRVSTEGDRNQTDALVGFGGVGVFTREIQNAVLDGRADMAVHSLKDLPTEPHPELRLSGIPSRAPRFDALLLPESAPQIDSLAELKESAVVATGSPRRRAQLAARRPDLTFCDVRGNVETRIKKLDAGEFDALVLAEAGLIRLDLANRISLVLQPPDVLPAVGQAALGIECRADDSEVIELLSALCDPATVAEVTAERAALAELKAGCHAPVAAWCRADGDGLKLDLRVLHPHGRQEYVATRSGPPEQAEEIGRLAARDVIAAGASSVL